MRIWLISIGEPLPVPANKGERWHRTGVFARTLVQNGCDVTWWTSTFDHAHKRHHSNGDQTVSVDNSLRIVMLHGGGYRSNMSFSRILDHRKIARKFSRIATSHQKPDLILCSFPPIELSLAATRFGKKFGIPVVLDLRDMWPDIFLDHMPPLLRPAGKLLTYQMFRNASEACAGATAIIGITRAFVEWGLAKGGRTLTQWDRAFPMGYVSAPPNPEQIEQAERYWDGIGIHRGAGEFNVCFVGSMGRQFDLATVIKVAKRLSQSCQRIRFVLCGTGDCLENFRRLAADAPNIMFPGWINASQIQVLMRRSALGLNPLPDRYDFLATINNKAIEYLSAGLPVISSPDRGVLYELLREHHCGASYAANDADALVSHLKMLHDNRDMRQIMSQNARRLFEQQFTAEDVYVKMFSHLKDIARQSMRNQSVG